MIGQFLSFKDERGDFLSAGHTSLCEPSSSHGSDHTGNPHGNTKTDPDPSDLWGVDVRVMPDFSSYFR